MAIAHPENWVVGDRVRFGRGFTCIEAQSEVRLGNDVAFFPNTFIQGKGRFVVGDHVGFYPGSYLSIGGATAFIAVGSRTHFAAGCALYGHGGLTIGECCAIAAHCVLSTVAHDHHVRGKLMIETGMSAPIMLVRDVWLGANATVVPGVTIAEGCVVGAGAVVTRSTEPYGVYLGVPARRAAERER